MRFLKGTNSTVIFQKQQLPLPPQDFPAAPQSGAGRRGFSRTPSGCRVILTQGVGARPGTPVPPAVPLQGPAGRADGPDHCVAGRGRAPQRSRALRGGPPGAGQACTQTERDTRVRARAAEQAGPQRARERTLPSGQSARGPREPDAERAPQRPERYGADRSLQAAGARA